MTQKEDLENYLQTCELPEKRFYIKRHKLKPKDLHEMAEDTTFEILGDPVIEIKNRDGFIFCKCRVCGHRRNVSIPALKKKQVTCKVCFNNKLKEEANLAGLEYIGPAENDLQSRMYKFISCGHTKKIRTEYVRKQNVFCRDCLYDRVIKACTEKNFTPLVEKETCTYKFKAKCNDCGDVQNKCVNSVGYCPICMSNRKDTEAIRQGAVRLKWVKANHSLYRLKCGHEQVIPDSSFAKGGYWCHACMYSSIIKDAQICGATVNLRSRVDPSKDKYKYECILKCGHIQYVRRDALARGFIYCEECKDNHYSNKSGIYLIEIEINNFKFLKLGMSAYLEKRISDYGLPQNSSLTVLEYINMESGYDAVRKEKALHKKYRGLKLDNEDIKSYMKSGFSECYPIHLKEALLHELSLL